MLKDRDKDSIILGINGWKQRGHDPSVCLLINGTIASFVEEERFIRQRYAFDTFPTHAILYALESNTVSPDQISTIIFGWDMPLVYENNGLEFPYSDDELLAELFPEKLYGQLVFDPNLEIHFMNHYLAHASSAFRVSGLSEAAILVLDGQGETQSGVMGKAENGEIDFLKSFPVQYSLGYFIEAACIFLGLRSLDAGKLMGLASYGDSIYEFVDFELISDGYRVKDAPEKLEEGLDQQKMMIDFWLERFQKMFPNYQPQKNRTFDLLKGKAEQSLEVGDFERSFAASIQSTLENILLHLVGVLINETSCSDLIYAGGIALNCVANGKLLSSDLINSLFIQPAANDAGVSLGAALEYGYQEHGYSYQKMEHCYFGPEYSNEEIRAELTRLKVPFKHESDIAKKTAQAVYEGKVVAWFQGKMEVGPRALGSRSIIANPTIKEMRELVNIIKSREQWRPLAPSIKEDKVDDYFKEGLTSPFMLVAQTVKANRRNDIPAIVHVDGSARLQSVSPEINRLYFQMIDEFEGLSGESLVMNTSFNIGGEPIVMTPEQAIQAFFMSPIDCLAIGNFWISKDFENPEKIPLSIIIPCADDERIQGCLSSIDEEVEVIVALNDPSEEVRGIVSSFPVKTVEIEERNLPKALNVGIDAASNDQVLLIDSDCVLTPGSIKKMYQGLQGKYFCKGKVIFESNDFTSSVIARLRDYTNFNVPKTYNPFLAIDKNVEDLIGGYIFDSDIYWTEDADLNKRVQEAGLEINYEDQAVAYHPTLTLKQDLKSAFKYGIGKRIRVEKKIAKGIGNYFSRLFDIAKKKGLVASFYMLIWSIVYTSGYFYQIARDPYGTKHQNKS